jgi:hypothetical protein
VVAAATIAAICIVSGFSYLRELQFPARSVAMKGLPVELRVQDGVPPNELRAITDGLRLTDRFMRKELRRSVRRPVEARVARQNGCRPFQSPGSASIGEADDGFLCVATGNLHWQWLVKKDVAAARAVSAHEYVHVLQAELGCLPGSRQFRFRWLAEGMAEAVAWRALIAAGRASNRRVEDTIRADALPDHGLVGSDLQPLAAYERADGADREYALWHLAVRHLLSDAVDSGAAPRAHPEISLRRFCERVGEGMHWRDAFARAFGQPVERFYSEFEQFRRRGDTR